MNGQNYFRLDDLDPSRCTEEYSSACLMISKEWGWTGMKVRMWEGMYGPYEQSKRADFIWIRSRNCMKKGYVYPCNKSRKDIWHAGLIDASGKEYLYPRAFDLNQSGVVR